MQGIKRGIIEMADAIIINKADGDNLKAGEAGQNMNSESALHLYPPKANGWIPSVTDRILNRKGEGTSDKVWQLILEEFKI